MRIATLVPSATDLVVALGLERHLVGVSHECDHPAAAALPVLTRSFVPKAPEADPAVVDQAVSDAVAGGSSLYLADRARLSALAPDWVIGQDVCDVCAVSGSEAQAALPTGSRLLQLSATSVARLHQDLRRLGDALGQLARAEAVIAGLEAALEAARDEAFPTAEGRRVLTLEWGRPPFVGGHWVPELVERLGARHLLVGPGEPSRRVSWAALRAERPDLVVFMPCGYRIDEAEREARGLGELADLHAPVWATDAARLFSRCTPDALSQGARALAALLSGRVPDPGDARLTRPLPQP